MDFPLGILEKKKHLKQTQDAIHLLHLSLDDLQLLCRRRCLAGLQQILGEGQQIARNPRVEPMGCRSWALVWWI